MKRGSDGERQWEKKREREKRRKGEMEEEI